MRAERLISMMMLLQANRRMTADTLAERLAVSVRTVYRDIDALSLAGVPVYTQAGTHGGIFLDEDYRVRLTGLTRNDLASLVVGGGSTPLQTLGLAPQAEATRLKLLDALPAQQRAIADHIRQRVYIDTDQWFREIEELPCLPELQQAVWDDRIIEAEYRNAQGEVVSRRVAACALVAKGHLWYLIARKPDGAYRSYRVSRFVRVAVTDERFIRDPGFDLARYWTTSAADFETSVRRSEVPYPVSLYVSPEGLRALDYILERPSSTVGPTDDAGWTTVSIQFGSSWVALQRVLALGRHARVLGPDSLRERVLDTARQIVDAYG